jgi:hypothetical protein
MEELTVWVGSFQSAREGMQVSGTQPVTFVGAELATVMHYASGRDTWKRKETRFRTGDGGFMLYVRGQSLEAAPGPT